MRRQTCLAWIIHYYNHERIPLKLNKLAPIDYRGQLID
ncbi:IS3 family transposase [Paenibacillus sp. NPDC058071]